MWWGNILALVWVIVTFGFGGVYLFIWARRTLN